MRILIAIVGLLVVLPGMARALINVGAVDTPSIDVEVVGGLAYVAGGSGLRVIDVSNPTLPVEVGALDTPGNARGVDVVGDLAYVADSSFGGGGLRVIDVSNPMLPVEIGALDTPGGGMDVEVVGEFAYLAANSAGLRVIDVSNPTLPVEVGALVDTAGAAQAVRAVQVVGDLAYVVDGSFGL
ncbi:MAG: hypothetical protein JRG92_24295, partial [Deltaproteobacteria bacterium]|nr:hypothetical protein [Deltaproteobacteria bacterium]